jgi:DNA-binding IclR family transcriptional regulator
MRCLLLAMAATAEAGLRTPEGYRGCTVEGLAHLTGFGVSTIGADLRYLTRLGYVVKAHAGHYRFRENP